MKLRLKSGWHTSYIGDTMLAVLCKYSLFGFPLVLLLFFEGMLLSDQRWSSSAIAHFRWQTQSIIIIRNFPWKHVYRPFITIFRLEREKDTEQENKNEAEGGTGVDDIWFQVSEGRYVVYRTFQSLSQTDAEEGNMIIHAFKGGRACVSHILVYNKPQADGKKKVAWYEV